LDRRAGRRLVAEADDRLVASAQRERSLAAVGRAQLAAHAFTSGLERRWQLARQGVERAPHRAAWQRPLRKRDLEPGLVDEQLARLYAPAGRAPEDFSRPAGEPALTAPDSVSWKVCKNPVVLFVGGVAAVVLELAEPRVRTGVWEHSSFRERPLERLQGT